VLYTTWFVCAKELLAESERAVSEPQCHMGTDSDTDIVPALPCSLPLLDSCSRSMK
jgi:hypothetical protein